MGRDSREEMVSIYREASLDFGEIMVWDSVQLGNGTGLIWNCICSLKKNEKVKCSNKAKSMQQTHQMGTP